MKQFDFKKIKEFRDAAGMTQDALAMVMSTPENRVYVQQISDWENRKDGGLNVTSLAKLADALGKTTDDFFVES
jgi:transcriptional regulator with XRE-family HTH domain